MSVFERSNTSAWQLLQTKDLPPESFCKSVATKFQQHIWHAWNRAGFCDYHHIGGLKAPVARVVKNRRQHEQPRSADAVIAAENRRFEPAADRQDMATAHGAAPLRMRASAPLNTQKEPVSGN